MQTLRRIVALGAFLLVTCSGEEGPVSPERSREAPTLSAMVRADPAPPEPLEPSAEELEGEVHPYEGWSGWCDQDWDWGCETDADCADRTDPVGHRLYCMTPRWARNKPEVTDKVCRPGSFGRERRRAEKRRLRAIVGELCSPPDWYEEGTACWQYKWKKARECKRAQWCDPDKLTRFLGIVAHRESTWKPYVRHRLGPDRVANANAYLWRDDEYGWDIEVDEEGNLIKADRLRPDANPHYPEYGRWSTGVGYYGQNAPIYVQQWEKLAPPEILCRPVEATESYLRVARRSWKKIRGGIDCDNDGTREFFGSAIKNEKPYPAWVDVHQAASVGSICPKDFAHDRFARRAKRAKLKFDEPVELEALGAGIPREGQNERAAEIYAHLDGVLAR